MPKSKKRTRTEVVESGGMTVGQLQRMLLDLLRSGQVKLTTEVWLSSDGEGNYFAPFRSFDNGSLNVAIEQRPNRLILYPMS